MKVLWDLGAHEIKKFNQSFYSSKLLEMKKATIKIPTETQKKKISKSQHVLKQDYNRVKSRQLHTLHNRFGEQQDKRLL
jgi:hypothetical protein